METRCIVFFHSIGALAKRTTVGLCFHLAAFSSFLSPLLADDSRISECPDAHLLALAIHRIREAEGRLSTFACRPVIAHISPAPAGSSSRRCQAQAPASPCRWHETWFQREHAPNRIDQISCKSKWWRQFQRDSRPQLSNSFIFSRNDDANVQDLDVVCHLSNLLSIVYGGGGGSRTRVRNRCQQREAPCSVAFRRFRFARSEPTRCAHR